MGAAGELLDDSRLVGVLVLVESWWVSWGSVRGGSRDRQEIVAGEGEEGLTTDTRREETDHRWDPQDEAFQAQA